MDNQFIQLTVINLIISIIVALITAKLSIKEFYKQEIWLRKESRYSQIINDISILQRYYGDIVDEAMGIPKVNNGDDFLKKEYIQSRRQLEMVTLSQGFILKKGVSEVLSQLFISSENKTSDERKGDYFSYFDRMHFETKIAKEKIIKIANKDLRV